MNENTREHPMDQVLGDLILRASKNGGSWALDLLDDGKGFSFKHELPPVDEYEPPAAIRSHTFDDPMSLATYAGIHGDSEKALIFFDDQSIDLVMDDSIERGAREIMRCSWKYSIDFEWWMDVIGKVIPYQKLRDVLPLHAHTLDSPEMLGALRNIKYTETVKYDSEIKPDEATHGIVFEVKGGHETIRKIPREFNINVPILDCDVISEDGHKVITVHVEVQMPSKPGEPLYIIMVCPDLERARRKRLDAAMKEIASALGDKWLILAGQCKVTPRRVGQSDRFRALEPLDR